MTGERFAPATYSVEPPPPPAPRVADIQEATCARFAVTMLDLRSDRRSRSIARPRQVAMFLCRELTPRSLTEIGRLFGRRDHSTVIHAVKVVGDLVQRDPGLAADMSAIRVSVGLRLLGRQAGELQ